MRVLFVLSCLLFIGCSIEPEPLRLEDVYDPSTCFKIDTFSRNDQILCVRCEFQKMDTSKVEVIDEGNIGPLSPTRKASIIERIEPFERYLDIHFDDQGEPDSIVYYTWGLTLVLDSSTDDLIFAQTLNKDSTMYLTYRLKP